MTPALRGEGGWPNSDQRKGGCVNLVLTRGREGVKIPEKLEDVICTCPLNGCPLKRGARLEGGASIRLPLGKLWLLWASPSFTGWAKQDLTLQPPPTHPMGGSSQAELEVLPYQALRAPEMAAHSGHSLKCHWASLITALSLWKGQTGEISSSLEDMMGVAAARRPSSTKGESGGQWRTCPLPDRVRGSMEEFPKCQNESDDDDWMHCRFDVRRCEEQARGAGGAGRRCWGT